MIDSEHITSDQGEIISPLGYGVIERRSETRSQSVLQVAKITVGNREELCILRNVSPTGLRADVYCDVVEGDKVLVELKTGRQITGHIIWTNGRSIGIEFERKIPILSYLAHHAIEELGKRVRAPRVRIDEPGIMRIHDGEFPIVIIDASQAGVRVRTDHVLFMGGACRIHLDSLGERGGFVRWCRDTEAGIILKQPLTFDDFATWRQHSRKLALHN